MNIYESLLNDLPIEKTFKLKTWESSDIGKVIYCEYDDDFYLGTKTGWVKLNQQFTGGSGETGGIGLRGLIGSIGGTGGTGNTGRTGGTGGTGDTGGTGGTGFTGDTGGTGRRGNSGGIGGRGQSAKTGGSGGTGHIGQTGLCAESISIQGDGEYGIEYGVIEVEFLGISYDEISLEIKDVYNGISYPKTIIFVNTRINNIYYSEDKSEITIWHEKVYPKEFKVSISNIVYNDTGKDLKIYSSQFITFRLFNSLDGTFKQFTPTILPGKKIIIQVIYIIECTKGSLHNLKVLKIGDPDAIIISDPEGIKCGEECDNVFSYKDEIKLFAQPSNYMYEFKKWIGCDTTIKNIAYVKMKCQERIIAALFKKRRFILTVKIIGVGKVETVTTSDINCPDSCEYEYEINTVVILKESPGYAHKFKYWIIDSHDIFTDTRETINIKITRNISVSAVFEVIKYSVSITIIDSWNGCVTGDNDKIKVCDTNVYSYIYGSKFTLLVSKIRDGYYFSHWTEPYKTEILSISNALDIEVIKPIHLWCHFKEQPALRVFPKVVNDTYTYSNKFSVNSEIFTFYYKHLPLNTHVSVSISYIDPTYEFVDWYDYDNEVILTTSQSYEFDLTEDRRIQCRFAGEVKIYVSALNYARYTDGFTGSNYMKVTSSISGLNFKPDINYPNRYNHTSSTRCKYSAIFTLTIESTDPDKERFDFWQFGIFPDQTTIHSRKLTVTINVSEYVRSELWIYVRFRVAPTLWFLADQRALINNVILYSFKSGEKKQTDITMPAYYLSMCSYQASFGEHLQIEYLNPEGTDISDYCNQLRFFSFEGSSSLSLPCSPESDRGGLLGFGYTGIVDLIVPTYEVETYGEFNSEYTYFESKYIYPVGWGQELRIHLGFIFDYSPTELTSPLSLISKNYSLECKAQFVTIYNLNFSEPNIKLIPYDDYGCPYQFYIFNKMQFYFNFSSALYQSDVMSDDNHNDIILKTSDFPNKIMIVYMKSFSSYYTRNARFKIEGYTPT